MKPILVITCILIFTTPLLSIDIYTGMDKAELKNFSDNIMLLIKDEKFKDAFTVIRKFWPMPESEIDMLEMQTTKQLDMVKARFGSALEFILIDQREIKDNFIRYIYVIKYERHITRWEFIYYKPKTKWLLNTFKWDDDVSKLF